MRRTADEFDTQLRQRRQRRKGPCAGPCHNQMAELRQLAPEPLCGACLEKLRRTEARESDPQAAFKHAKKRQKKVRLELNKILNAADALEGFIADNDCLELERIAKVYLLPIMDAPQNDGHGHEEIRRDRAFDTNGGAPAGHDPVSESETAAGIRSTIVVEPQAVVDGAPHQAATTAPIRNAWFDLTLVEQAKFAADRRRESQAKKRLEAEQNVEPPDSTD